MGLCGFGCVALTILYAHGFGYVAMTILCVPGSVWVWACGYEWLFCVHLGLCEFGYVATSACFVHVHLGLSASVCSNGTGTIHTVLSGPHTQLGVG